MFLFETMHVADGQVPLWPWHEQRLLRSIKSLGWQPVSLEIPEAPDGVLRLRVFPDGAFDWEVRPLPVAPEPYVVGISPIVVDPRDPGLYHKSSHREVYDRAAKWAAERGMADAFLVNRHGFITESTIANLIVAVKGAWYTPPLYDGLLPGVMRQVLLESGRMTEKSLTSADMRSADELYLCNAVRGIFPIILDRSRL